MKTYRLDPAKLPAQKKTIMLVYGITFLLMSALSIGINWNRASMKSLIWMLPLIAALFVYSGWRAFKQRDQLWEDYSFQVDEDGLLVHLPKFPELKVSKRDITEIEDVKNGTYVSTTRGRRLFAIPNLLPDADYAELHALMQRWIEENKHPAAPAEAEAVEAGEQTAEEAAQPGGEDQPA
ncbi:MAG TPA: hypothetical protein PK137_02990 [Anaerolineaceae bacterium]|nr:hypothetical protein [Anaerolineales bacterium]HOG58921.1 hypothetical protein [Anaerolineaceae bacterium]HOT53676.1 hypothetical protein [Anaerolineaceae bacterium]HPL42801.1 hypothetical protein [Anaerolineaceae bacterium]